MKQNIQPPVAIGIVVVVVGALAFFLYSRYMAGPPIDNKSTGPSAAGMQRPAGFENMSVDQKKQLYGMQRPK